MNYLIYSLPVTTKEYTFSKYIYCIINTIIAIFISTILSMIVQLIGITKFTNVTTTYTILLSIAIIGIFFTTVLMPATLLLGFEKRKYVLVFIAVFPICFSNALVEIILQINISLSTPTLSILGILISIVVLLTSYFITINKFSQKEVQ